LEIEKEKIKLKIIFLKKLMFISKIKKIIEKNISQKLI
jgi:hypothetical protein